MRGSGGGLQRADQNILHTTPKNLLFVTEKVSPKVSPSSRNDHGRFRGRLVSRLLSITSVKSGREDLNFRPLGPEPSALARLSYAPIHPGRFHCTPIAVSVKMIRCGQDPGRRSAPNSTRVRPAGAIVGWSFWEGLPWNGSNPGRGPGDVWKAARVIHCLSRFRGFISLASLGRPAD